MADVTLGRFIFDFIANTSGLDKGLEQSTKKSQELATELERLLIVLDVIAVKMNSAGLSTKDNAKAAEMLQNLNVRLRESQEDLTSALITMTENLRDQTSAQKDLGEESRKTDETRDKQGRGLSAFTKKLIVLAAAYLSVSKAADSFRTSFVGNFEIAKFTELLDINAATVKNWMNIVKLIGGSGEDIIETFKNISIGLGEIDIAGTGSEVLIMANKLGVAIRDELGKNLKPDQILLNLSAAFQREDLPKEDVLFIGQSLGINENVLRLLNRGPEEINKLLAEQEQKQHQLTEAELEKFRKINAEVAMLKQSFDSLFTEVLLKFADDFIIIIQAIDKAVQFLRNPLGPAGLGITDAEGNFPDAGAVLNNLFKNIQADIERNRMERINTIRGAHGMDPIDAEGRPLTSIGGGGGSTSVIVGDLTINTQATDAQGIAVDVVSSLKRAIEGEFTVVSERLGDSVLA